MASSRTEQCTLPSPPTDRYFTFCRRSTLEGPEYNNTGTPDRLIAKMKGVHLPTTKPVRDFAHMMTKELQEEEKRSKDATDAINSLSERLSALENQTKEIPELRQQVEEIPKLRQQVKWQSNQIDTLITDRNRHQRTSIHLQTEAESIRLREAAYNRRARGVRTQEVIWGISITILNGDTP